MLDILLDSILDVLKLLPFLFIAFLIIELIEHKFHDKSKKIMAKSGRFGPVVGGALGAVPQCGFGVLATNLFVTKIISVGTIVAIYLATSDEMIPVMISHHVGGAFIVKTVLLKVLIGIVAGLIIDLIFLRKPKEDFHICEDCHCDCDESIFKSSIIHTLKIALFIFVINIILNTVFFYFEDSISNIFINNKVLTPFISSLIGLIPNCGASVTITELYLSGVISYGSMLAGLLTGSGVGILVLFKSNKNIKENIGILLTIYLIGVACGIILNLI